MEVKAESEEQPSSLDTMIWSPVSRVQQGLRKVCHLRDDKPSQFEVSEAVFGRAAVTVIIESPSSARAGSRYGDNRIGHRCASASVKQSKRVTWFPRSKQCL